MAINLQGTCTLLQVFDMPTALKFYRDVLGFGIIQSSGNSDDVDWVLLRLNDTELMLNTAYEKHDRPSQRDKGREAGHADTALYFGCPDVDLTYLQLCTKGVDLRKPFLTKYGWKALELSDPDGYQLCFHWPLEDATRNA
jgi:glyoxylase I family protein